MVNLSVAIPTYNGETRLPDVLDRLRSQIDTESFSWEILVIDNNSTDNTAQVVREYQTNWPASYPLKYYFAPEQGAAFARQRAVEKANGELIAFLDDDNLPENNWVCAAYQFGQQHPNVGAYGSQIHGYFFEQTDGDSLPENFEKIACFLAIVERGKTAHLYNPEHKILPPGAGLAIRKEAWLANVPKRLFLNHTGKKAGIASEDLEALLHIQKAGWEIWYNPEMVVYHKIPNDRLNIDYLRILTRCVGLSRHRLRMMTLKSWQRPFAFPAYLANDFRRLAIHLIKHGPMVKTDPVAACQMEFLSSTLISPLFLLKKKYDDRRQGKPSKKELQNVDSILNQIAEGFEEDRFCLYSQEICSTTQSASLATHSEILLRLQNSQGEILQAGQFMPIAEHYNLMRAIDRWVIRTLFRQIAQSTNYQHRSLYEINFSVASLNDPTFIAFLKQEFAKYEIYPETTCFAMPEYRAISNLDPLLEFAHFLKDIGSHLALDHVGRQAIPPDYLKKLPVDYLKIDGQFVKKVSQNCQVFHKIEALNELGHKLGIQTIAEAVETQDILEQIKSIGVNYVQGYGIAPTYPFNATDRLNRIDLAPQLEMLPHHQS